MEPEPLYLYTPERPTPEQLEKLKAAKQASGLETLVKPARAFPGCGRVLVIGDGMPDFYCEWANTSWDDPKLPQKIKWVVTGLDGRPRSHLEWMQALFGAETKEVTSG